MRTIFLIIFSLLFFLWACGRKEDSSIINTPQTKRYTAFYPQFQELLDSAGLIGSILLYNPVKDTYHSNDFEWARKGQLPASTFKIPNSIISLETGVVKNENQLFPWDGITRGNENWNHDLSFSDAFAYSCVPCFQRIARTVGADTMRKYLDRLDYPGISFRQNEIDMFWLQGESCINQFEQIEFLQRLHDEELPVATKTTLIMRRIMAIDTTATYILFGKTGWSQANGKDNGWFVGFAERRMKKGMEQDNQLLYFATNIEPKAGTSIEAFIAARREVTEAAIAQLEW